MRKIYTLLVLCLFAIAAIAQDATLKKLAAGCPLTVDGVAENWWADVDEYPIDVAMGTEEPTFDGTWQAVWNDTAIIVLVSIIDDEWCASWCSGAADWQSDKPEVYFDMNVGALVDGLGPSASSATAVNGHFQAAPGPSTSQTTDTSTASAFGQAALSFVYGYHIDDPDEYWQYAASRATLIDKDGNTVDLSAAPIIGFDVTFIDRETGDADRKRASWKNSGGADASTENWANMDEAGEITFTTDEITCDVGVNTTELTQISVYPNPAEDIITINAGNEIYLYNAIGQVVFNQQITSSRVDISDVASGLYIISVLENGTEIGSTYLLVK